MGPSRLRLAQRTLRDPTAENRRHFTLGGSAGMAIILPAQQSCPRAWVEACLALIREGGEGYNVLIEVTDPVTHDAQNVEVIKLVNAFLSERGCGANPISTVCNTIFPQGLLR